MARLRDLQARFRGHMSNQEFDEFVADDELTTSLSYWQLCEELSVIEAALLIIGKDPAKFEYVESWSVENRPQGYEAIKKALINAVMAGKLKAKVRYVAYESKGYVTTLRLLDSEEIRKIDEKDIAFSRHPDIATTTIDVPDLKRWLTERNFKSDFFLNTPISTAKDDSLPLYLDKNHPCYSPKLAAAINAWLAASQDKKCLSREELPSCYIESYLKRHAAEFELIKKDGTLNSLGIEEIKKVANWNSKGGARKTPS
jgi:hypothetical protein